MLELEDGEMKAHTPVSRRALRGRLRHVLAQAIAYGLCAEETMRLTLASVIVVGSNGPVEERVTPATRRYVESLARGLWRMVAAQLPPAPLRGPRCGYCSYSTLCRALG